MDANKNEQASKIIAAQISKIAANQPMDYSTIGATKGMTKREGEAESMARYFVTKMYGVKFSGSLYENWTQEERDANEAVKSISAAAIAITGK
jgi:hypothetical protein